MEFLKAFIAHNFILIFDSQMTQNWLALMIGNSRLHWAWFWGDRLIKAWDTQHYSTTVAPDALLRELLPIDWDQPLTVRPPLYLASVVESQTAFWQAYRASRLITRDRIPLKGIYPTLGVDRALALWGVGQTYGFPALVIDAGTALTLTGADGRGALVGGAILPGLTLQARSLSGGTHALPDIPIPAQFPPRWALNTPQAMQSGILYSVLAGMRDFIQDWWQRFPTSSVILTGGDAGVLHPALKMHSPAMTERIVLDPHVVFWGIQGVRSRLS